MRPTINIPVYELNALNTLQRTLKHAWESNLVSVILFGSKARGSHRRDSDIDVLVVARNLTEDKRNFLYDLVMRIVDTHGVYLSVKLFSAQEFKQYQKVPTPFIQNVLREGIPV